MNKQFFALIEGIVTRFYNFIGSPKKVLAAAAGVGVVALAAALLFPNIYRDSVNYMASVNALWLQNWRTAFNLTYVPLLFVIGALFRPLGLDACQCLTLVSSLLALGMLFLGYRVLSYYMDKRWAAWGSVLFFLTPTVFAISFCPLTDSSRWFSILLCWWTILLYLERPKAYKLFGIGAAYAFFALVRSEGIVFAGLFTLWFFFEQWRTQRRSAEGVRWGRIVVSTVAPVIFMLVLISPRLIQIYRETGFPALDTRQTWAIKGVLTQLAGKEVTAPEVGQDPLVTYNFHDLKFHYSYLQNERFVNRYWKNFLTGNYRFFLAFTLLGLVYIVWRRKWQHIHTLSCVFVAANAIAYGLMRSGAGRYFFINTFLMMPFTLAGFHCIWAFCRDFRSWTALAAKFLFPCAAIAVVVTFIVLGMHNVLPSGGDCYAEIGRFMRSESAAAKPRSGTAHPVYLILGDNYGWGFFCNGNELVYSVQFKMDSRYRVSEILTAGVPPDYCSFAVDPLRNVRELKPDYLLVNGNDFPPNALDGCSGLLESIPQTISDKVRLYRVTSGLEAK